MTTSWPHLQFVVLAFLWPHFARRARETACKCALIKICYVVPSAAPLPPSYRNLCLSVESQFGFYARCALKVSENFFLNYATFSTVLVNQLCTLLCIRVFSPRLHIACPQRNAGTPGVCVAPLMQITQTRDMCAPQ